jgi:hypothetical protein
LDFITKVIPLEKENAFILISPAHKKVIKEGQKRVINIFCARKNSMTSIVCSSRNKKKSEKQKYFASLKPAQFIPLLLTKRAVTFIKTLVFQQSYSLRLKRFSGFFLKVNFVPLE